MIRAVSRPGPSSKVRATVFPLPGAVKCTADDVAGQAVAAVFRSVRPLVPGAAAAAGSALSTRTPSTAAITTRAERGTAPSSR